MATNRKDTKIDVEALKAVLAENPNIIKDIISGMGLEPKGEKSYTIIGIKEVELPMHKMDGTKIMDNGVRKVKSYGVRTMNGNVLWIPEFCLADYGIDVEHGGMVVDEDGLTVGQERAAIEQGAY